MSTFMIRRNAFDSDFSEDKTKFVVNRSFVKTTKSYALSQFKVTRMKQMLKFPIKLDPGQGSVETTEIISTIGDKIGNLPQAHHPLFVFQGWYTSPEGGKQITPDTIATYDTQVLYAHYVSHSYTVDLNGQWFLDDRSGKDPNGKAYGTTYSTNPDTNQYDGTYISYSNFNVNNGFAKMRVNFVGYSEFVLYIRSYAESNYDYTIAGKIDKSITTNIDYANALTYQHTRGSQTSGTAISNYKKVTYSNLDGGQHFIDIIYRKDSSQHTSQDRGYVLIPKNQ